MSKMGLYCKAIPVKMLRKFPEWPQQGLPGNGSQSKSGEHGETDEEIVYLQQDYSVTGGLFLDEDVVFRSDAASWLAFCKDELRFDPQSALGAER
jgi:hypothetical protein